MSKVADSRPEEEDECKKAKEAWSSIEENVYAGSVKMRMRVSHWAKTTTMHGIAKLADDEIEQPSLFIRIFWTLLLLCSLMLLAYQVSQLVIKYSQYPVSTRRYDEDVPTVQFPAVTICPINGVSNYRIQQRMDTINGLLGYIYAATPAVNLSKSATTANMTCEEKWRLTMSNVPSKDNYLMGSYGMAINALNSSVLASIAVPLPEMLLDCSYYGMQCAPKDFVAFRNSAFGFCYTFNLNGSRTSSSYGPMNGMQMTLALNQSDYMENGYGDAGYRILIHEPNTYPFAEASGFHLSPGTSVQIGLTFRKYDTVPPPYGTCRDYMASENLLLNAYVGAAVPSIGGSSDEIATVGYSHQTCIRTCKQRAAVKTCGCFLPCTYATEAQRNALRPCEVRAGIATNVTSCYELVYPVDCTDRCKFPCSGLAYRAGTSFAQFPAKSYLARLLELASGGGFAWDIAKATADRTLMDFARSNFLRVTVFAEEIKMHGTEDSPSYQMKDLLSDCGGQAGFWVGLSVLTVFEFVDLLTQLCRVYLAGE